jgi:hypothetical protein
LIRKYRDFGDPDSLRGNDGKNLGIEMEVFGSLSVGPGNRGELSILQKIVADHR